MPRGGAERGERGGCCCCCCCAWDWPTHVVADDGAVPSALGEDALARVVGGIHVDVWHPEQAQAGGGAVKTANTKNSVQTAQQRQSANERKGLDSFAKDATAPLIYLYRARSTKALGRAVELSSGRSILSLSCIGAMLYRWMQHGSGSLPPRYGHNPRARSFLRTNASSRGRFKRGQPVASHPSVASEALVLPHPGR